MATVQRKLVHKQFNSPMGLYSKQNIKETLDRELKAFGAEGIEIDEQITKPLNLANSEVLRAVEEEEHIKCGYKRVAWPPPSEERVVREFTPQPQTQGQPMPPYNQQYQQQPTAATQGPIYDNVQHHAPHKAKIVARETNSPYNRNQIQNQYEPFPSQAPQTPIVLTDKQFSRQSSHEPNQINGAAYHQQKQQPSIAQPQNQPKQKYLQQQQQQQQQHHQQKHHRYRQSSYNQQIGQQRYQTNLRNVSYPQKQQQQQQYATSSHVTGWRPVRPPQTKAISVKEHSATTTTTSIYQQKNHNYYQQPQPVQYCSPKKQQPYHAPSYDNQQPLQYQQSPQKYCPQAQYQAQTPPSHNPYQKPAEQSVSQYQQPQQNYQQPPWAQQQQQQQYQQSQQIQQQQQLPQYQSPFNQYNQAPHQQPYNQYVPKPNQQQFNSYSQPQHQSPPQQQQQQRTVSHDQVDQQPQLTHDQRGASPGIITLRKEAPITQKPSLIYNSQPAALSFQGGSNMRGDLKWPPPEYKEAAAKENEERRKLAMGPVCRPRKVHRDYTSFFAKNALSHHYPSYKVPPGTQHMTC